MSTENNQFTVGQKVVYPSQGVGTVTEIFDKQMGDKTVAYYKIYIDVSDMNVMVPIKNAAMIGIRAIVTAEEAQKALDSLGEEIEPVTSDWKLRYQMNLELLKKGTISDIANIVRCLYHRSKVKELPILERKLYDNAKKLLIDEICFALELSEKDVESKIHAKLEPFGASVAKKPVIDPNDEDDDDDFLDEEEEERDSNDSDDDDEASDEDDSDDASDDEEDADDDE